MSAILAPLLVILNAALASPKYSITQEVSTEYTELMSTLNVVFSDSSILRKLKADAENRQRCRRYVFEHE
jgi:hypothetical protein